MRPNAPATCVRVGVQDSAATFMLRKFGSAVIFQINKPIGNNIRLRGYCTRLHHISHAVYDPASQPDRLHPTSDTTTSLTAGTDDGLKVADAEYVYLEGSIEQLGPEHIWYLLY